MYFYTLIYFEIYDFPIVTSMVLMALTMIKLSNWNAIDEKEYDFNYADEYDEDSTDDEYVYEYNYAHEYDNDSADDEYEYDYNYAHEYNENFKLEHRRRTAVYEYDYNNGYDSLCCQNFQIAMKQHPTVQFLQHLIGHHFPLQLRNYVVLVAAL